jgi:hypothetical protein
MLAGTLYRTKARKIKNSYKVFIEKPPYMDILRHFIIIGYEILHTEKNEKKAFWYFYLSALAGNGWACNQLVIYYRNGIGGKKKSYKKMRKWVLLTKESGAPEMCIPAENMFERMRNMCRHCLTDNAITIAPNKKGFVCKKCGKRFR